jgi:hypothetical protein
MKVSSLIVCLLSAVKVYADGDLGDQAAAVLPEIISTSDVAVDGFESIPDSNTAATQAELKKIVLENEQIQAKLSLNTQVLQDLENAHKQSIEGLNEIIRQQQSELQNNLAVLKSDDTANAASAAEIESSYSTTVNAIKNELSQCTQSLDLTKDIASITEQKLKFATDDLAKASTEQCDTQSGLLKIASDELSLTKTSSEECSKKSGLLSETNQEMTTRIALLEAAIAESKKAEESVKKESTKEPEHEENIYMKSLNEHLKSLNEHLFTFQKWTKDSYASIEIYLQDKVGSVKSYVNNTLLPYYHNDLQPQIMTLHKDFGTKVAAATSQIAPFMIATKTAIGDLYIANVKPSVTIASKYLESSYNEILPQTYKLVETIQKYYVNVIVPIFYNEVLPNIKVIRIAMGDQFSQGYKKAAELGAIYVMPTYNEVLLPFYDANMKEHVITIRENLSSFYNTYLKEFIDTNIKPVVNTISIKYNQFIGELKDEKSEIRKSIDNVIVLLKRDVGKIQNFCLECYSGSIEFLNNNELIKKYFGKNTKILVSTFVNGTLFYCFIIFLQLMRLVLIRSYKIKKLRTEEKNQMNNEIPVAVAVPISN